MLLQGFSYIVRCKQPIFEFRPNKHDALLIPCNTVTLFYFNIRYQIVHYLIFKLHSIYIKDTALRNIIITFCHKYMFIYIRTDYDLNK